MMNGVKTGDQPPMVAFGSQGGGSPLYINQEYRFGIAAGGEKPETLNDLKIEVYDRQAVDAGATNVAPIFTANYTLPRPSNQADWSDFTINRLTRDYHLLTNYSNRVIDFDTQVTYQTVDLGKGWRQSGKYNFVLMHKARNDSFYYKVSFMGSGCKDDSTAFFDMAKNSEKKAQSYNISYSLDFETPLPWRSKFINQPHFQGVAIPSEYQGKSLDELIHQTAKVVDNLAIPEQIGYDLKKINNSSELKSHPVLDKLVADLESDPLKIANYVLNEIELTDAMGYNMSTDKSPIDSTSINPQGVTRDALATYLEGEGSPIDQCALLVYLLRKAGYSACYVFPKQNTTLMFDAQLSKILKMQLRGVMSNIENANEPELIPVNYPWVAFFNKDKNNPKDPGKWIHLFPWIKNTKVIEGKNLWDYFSDGYNNAKQWLFKYLLNDPSIRNPLGTTDPAILKEDNIGSLFPLYAEKKLASNNLTIGDIGIQFINQPCHYDNWDDFPRPWQTESISSDNIAHNLEADQNPKLKEQLTDIFDTIEITVISDRSNSGDVDLKKHEADPTIQTGPIRIANLHDRNLLLHHEVIQNRTPAQYKMILSLDPYDTTEGSNDTQTYTFYHGDHPNPPSDQIFRNKQETSVILDHQDDKILYHILYRHHQQFLNQKIDWDKQFPGIAEITPVDSKLTLLKGDMACLSLFYGQVSTRMLNFQNTKFLQCQEALKENPDSLEKQTAMKGQFLSIVGDFYYKMVGDSEKMLERMTKTHAISYVAHGLSKLSPKCDEQNQIVLINNTNNQIQDLDLVYPNVDMSFQALAYVNNSSAHLDSGDTFQLAADTFGELLIGEISADEHRVINKLYGQENAISTVKLLDIAQGWTSATGLASQPGEGAVILTANNFKEEGNKEYIAKKITDHTPIKKSLSTWANLFTTYWIKEVPETLALSSHAQDNFIIMTPGPVTADAQQGVPYTGMGAMIFKNDSYASLITGRSTINGGYGQETHLFENSGSSINIPAMGIGDNTTFPNYKLDTNPPVNITTNSYSYNPYGPGGQYYYNPLFNKKSSTEGSLPTIPTPPPAVAPVTTPTLPTLPPIPTSPITDPTSNPIASPTPPTPTPTPTPGEKPAPPTTVPPFSTPIPTNPPTVAPVTTPTNPPTPPPAVAPVTTPTNPTLPPIPTSPTTDPTSNPIASPTPTPTPTPTPGEKPAPPTTVLPVSTPTPKSAITFIDEKGSMGLPVYYGKFKSFVKDPVSVVTGEFYANTVDLKLAGPMPLEIRRIYSSQSTVDESFGHGWKSSYFSYLVLSDDITPTVIGAAETDGSVIAYRYNSDQQSWIPLPSDNSTLINENDGNSLINKNLWGCTR
jgi:hypothetical protein